MSAPHDLNLHDLSNSEGTILLDLDQFIILHVIVGSILLSLVLSASSNPPDCSC